MRKSGFAFHCHHNVLVEYVYDYDERVRFIKKHKPPTEKALRLKLFKMIPDNRLPDILLKAWVAYDKAEVAYVKAWDACMPTLEKLHKELCPDCPWDGKTIFPK